jgi:uncharacterized protein YecE (DUF72 family)
MENKKFHIGTSGWCFKDWVGVFYPKNLKTSDWLNYYSKIFSCIEINSSFYRLPKKETVHNWINKVPKDFLFCVKMSRYLSHIKRLREPEEPLERFFGIFEPMKKQMGPILIQLPKTVQFDPVVTENFYKLLHEKYSEQQFAMEVRHESWLTEKSYGLMRDYNINFVISQSGQHFPYVEIITTKNIYFRFHGPGSLYDSKYTNAEMKKFSLLFKEWMQQGHELWIFFNNDWYGYGIENGLQLEEYLLQNH